MRVLRAVLIGVLSLAPAAASADPPRFTRCCLELVLPDVPPGPVCAQVRGRRRLGPRRVCRLLGGRPIGRGDCSLAACRGSS